MPQLREVGWNTSGAHGSCVGDLCLDLAREDLRPERRDDNGAGEGIDENTEEESEDASVQIGGVYEAEVARESFNDVKVHFSALVFIEKARSDVPEATRTHTGA